MASDFAARSRQFQDALYEALASTDTAVRDAGVMDQLAQLLDRARTVAGDHEHVAGALDALDAIARREDVDGGLSEAAALFASPQLFREALYFARCLDHDPASALELIDARGYVAAATVPVAAYADLATDQAALLDATTFATLWREPGRLRWMIDTTDLWQREYAPAYQRAHVAYNDAITGIVQSADALQPQVEALEKLNRLRKLGAPLAEDALTQFHDIERIFACPANAEHLSEALRDAPICAYCGFRLGDDAPTADAARVTSALERALGTQQTRLAQRVVTRLLARPGRRNEDHLDRFIQVVQASDLAGLAKVLDEGLLGFIDDLLDTPEPRINLIERLSREHPEVTPENLDAVVESFRRITTEELANSGGSVRIGPDEEPA